MITLEYYHHHESLQGEFHLHLHHYKHSYHYQQRNQKKKKSQKQLYRRGGKGELLGLQPPNFLLSKNVLKEILFTLKFLNQELNSFHSYKKRRFALL